MSTTGLNPTGWPVVGPMIGALAGQIQALIALARNEPPIDNIYEAIAGDGNDMPGIMQFLLERNIPADEQTILEVLTCGIRDSEIEEPNTGWYRLAPQPEM